MFVVAQQPSRKKRSTVEQYNNIESWIDGFFLGGRLRLLKQTLNLAILEVPAIVPRTPRLDSAYQHRDSAHDSTLPGICARGFNMIQPHFSPIEKVSKN